MLMRFLTLLIFTILAYGCGSPDELSIKQFSIEKIPSLLSVGSSLAIAPPKKSQRDADYFYSVSDGGNQPAIISIKVKKNIAGIDNVIPIKSDLKLDLEGIALADDGSFWLANEEGPSLIKFDIKSEKIEKVITPGNGLPLILRHMQPGRGFEGVAIYGNEIYAPLQSVLDINRKTKGTAQFIRVIKYNFQTEKVAMYAYPIDLSFSDHKRDTMISDIAIIDKDRFLVIEKSNTTNEQDFEIKIYLCDLSNANDITDLTIDDKEIEFEKDQFVIFGSTLSGKGGIAQPIRKKLILDLGTINWQGDQPEGLAIFPDFQTIAISNDSSTGKPILWIVKLPEPLFVDWISRTLWLSVFIIMILVIFWALLPQDNKIKFEVTVVPKDNDLVINEDSLINRSKQSD